MNDTVANTPLVVVFRERNATGLVFNCRIEGRVLTFVPAVSGAGEPLTIRDEQTGSVWSGVEGVALEGRLKGKRLEQIPTTWAANRTVPSGMPRRFAISWHRSPAPKFNRTTAWQSGGRRLAAACTAAVSERAKSCGAGSSRQLRSTPSRKVMPALGRLQSVPLGSPAVLRMKGFF